MIVMGPDGINAIASRYIFPCLLKGFFPLPL
jgi:hypothetical protein